MFYKRHLHVKVAQLRNKTPAVDAAPPAVRSAPGCCWVKLCPAAGCCSQRPGLNLDALHWRVVTTPAGDGTLGAETKRRCHPERATHSRFPRSGRSIKHQTCRWRSSEKCWEAEPKHKSVSAPLGDAEMEKAGEARQKYKRNDVTGVKACRVGFL